MRKKIRNACILLSIAVASLASINCATIGHVARGANLVTQAILSRLKRTSVRLYTRHGQCSGNVIRNKDGTAVIMTAAHCFFRSRYAAIQDYSGTKYIGTAYAIDHRVDIALIKVTGFSVNIPTLRISRNPPKEFSRVYMVGHPQGVGWIPSVGYFAGLYWTTFSKRYNFFLAADFGSSGSSVVNSDLEVVSILTRGSISNKFSTSGPTLSEIQVFIKKNGL